MADVIGETDWATTDLGGNLPESTFVFISDGVSIDFSDVLPPRLVTVIFYEPDNG